MLYDPDTRIVTLRAGASCQVLGQDVYATRDYPREGLEYFSEAFHCRPGQYHIELFFRLLDRVRKYAVADSRKITDCITNNVQQEPDVLTPERWQKQLDFHREWMSPGRRQGKRDLFNKRLSKFYAGAMQHALNDTTLLLNRLEKRMPTVLTHGEISSPHSWAVGDLLFDMQSPAYFKITSVVKTEKKGLVKSTVLTLDSGRKVTLSTDAQIEAFIKRYEAVSPRPLPPILESPPSTVHHYSRVRSSSGDTGITHIGWESIEELVYTEIKKALDVHYKVVHGAELPTKKRKWFS